MDLARESVILLKYHMTREQVSILVLMDLAREYLLSKQSEPLALCFNPCFNGSCSRILLVHCSRAHLRISFNPCFNGSCSRIVLPSNLHYREQSFNPCFNGSCSRISATIFVASVPVKVSILVLMDLARECF